MSIDLIKILTDGTYCSVKWADIWTNYNHHVHYRLLYFICIMGCVTNVLNLFIFTRPGMRNPTNVLLSALATTDLLCVFRKLVDISLIFHRQGIDKRTIYRLHVENWINEACFYLFHTWSIYMTVAVALWRLLGILRPMQSRYWFSYKSAILVTTIFVGFATLLVPLLFVGSSIKLSDSGLQSDDYQSFTLINGSMNRNDSSPVPFSNEQEYFEDESNLYDPDYIVVQTDIGRSLQFWTHGLLMKLIPCFTLMICTGLLIMSLRLAAKNRLTLFAGRELKTAPTPNPLNANNADRARNNIPTTNTCPSVAGQTRNEERSATSSATNEFAKTTKMLIILLILFLVTELPPGILLFCVGLITSEKFFLQCYLPIRSFMNLNEYISSSIKNRTNDENATLFGILMSKMHLSSSRYEEPVPINASNKNENNVSPTTTEEVFDYECLTEP